MSHNYRWPIGIGAGLWAGAVAYIVWKSHPYLWDLAIYQRAVGAYQSGGDPYEALGGGTFAYAPLALEVMTLIGFSTPVYLCVLLLALLALTVGSMRVLLFGALAASSIYIIFPVSFVNAFQTGNLAVPFHIALIFLLVYSGRLGIWAFYGAVLAFSIVKPTFLAYAIVPVFFGAMTLRRLAPFIGITVLWGIILYAQYLVTPDQFADFLRALDSQVVHIESPSGDGTGSETVIVGRTLYYYLGVAADLPNLVRLGIHWLVTGGVLLALHALARKRASLINDDTHRQIFLLCVGIVAVNIISPRLIVYDWFIMDAAALGAFLILAREGLDRVHVRIWPYLMLATTLMLVAATNTGLSIVREFHIAFCVYVPVIILSLQLLKLPDRRDDLQAS